MRGGFSPFGAVVSLFGAGLLVLVAPNLGMVLQAATPGAGTPGVFTAEQVSCIQHPGHTACMWQGVFRPADGASTREGVFLYGGREGLAVGQSTEARDVGRANQVYRPDGTREWILSGLLVLAGLFLIVQGGLFGLFRPPRLLRRRPRPPAPDLSEYERPVSERPVSEPLP
jgi:hypothetical protein